MRLIDADALNDDFDKRCWDGVQAVVDMMPTIDAVPVVRCKDCKNRGKKKCPLIMVRFDFKTNGKIKEILEQNHVGNDFWCKYGERKDGD